MNNNCVPRWRHLQCESLTPAATLETKMKSVNRTLLFAVLSCCSYCSVFVEFLLFVYISLSLNINASECVCASTCVCVSVHALGCVPSPFCEPDLRVQCSDCALWYGMYAGIIGRERERASTGCCRESREQPPTTPVEVTECTPGGGEQGGGGSVSLLFTHSLSHTHTLPHTHCQSLLCVTPSLFRPYTLSQAKV